MAMINCPECNKEISNKAFVCPDCGYPLSNNISNADFSIKKKTPGKGFGVSGLVMGILGVIYSPLTLVSALEYMNSAILKILQ